MATDIIIPSVGESVTEGVLSRWAVKDGQPVKLDDIVAELETDKVTLELRSPGPGVLKIAVAQGATVKIGQSIGSVVASAAAPASAAPSAPPSASPSPSSTPAASSASAPADSPAPASSAAGAFRATPVAEKLAKEHNINLADLPATGPGGRIREQDVLGAIEGRAAPAKASSSTPANAPAPALSTGANTLPQQTPASNGAAQHSEKAVSFAPPGAPGARSKSRERMTPLRQRIATRLVQAQHTAAMLTTFNEVDMSAVMDLRKSYKEEFEKKQGVGLGFMGFFVKATVAALKAFPLVNASIVDDEGGHLAVERHDYHDIAVAVGTPRGLVVPVLRDCDQRSFASIEGGIKDLALRARDGKLTLDEMQGGTFTITNGGIYGSLMSTPILNPPQSAILGMHAIKNRPMEYPAGSGQIAIRPMMYLALSYDHRIIDGAEAVQFLVRIKQGIEDPQRLLLGL